MTNLHRKGLVLEIPVSQNPNSTLNEGTFVGSSVYDWLFECHGFLHNAILILASLAFVLYLAFKAKKSFRKLSNGRSSIMIAYYGSLWLFSLLNLAWSCLQAWECTPGKELAWNILSLFTTSGMLFLEVSLIAFLLQGNYVGGLEDLTRPFGLSSLIVGLDLLLKALYLFGFGIPLFIDSSEHSNHMKWSLWAIHRLVLTAIYGLILFMYHSRWRERLPARPAFYKYIVIMFILNALSLFASALTGHVTGFGYWLYSTTIVCYHAFYLPLLYVTFLADFFQEEDLQLESVYYSEMKDAGFFDDDWD
ncbi:protein CANDIDATE G-PROTEINUPLED RECEPTOR 2-like [Populus alba x Populus x berolinensis]|uniref:Transmembrane protein adipocyte-associated 1-like n=2 Tax=Populus alba TaxID=43335 RepID=A0A4U5R1F4_POPAL|nr:protein CANDIDATE G-PROTEIN COUPLED RECEPTOR 2-like [Populus alba]KAJ6883637.1 protein CANDIDATE G-PROTEINUPLED RECEPTOR 2-like [Populus alba x Populus x berolinensis]TKS17533.1 transmembrane protein adipocyte-associated 1-like [Populus alba]